MPGDELFSDALPISLIDDIVYKVEGKYITVGGDIGIASNSDEGVDDQAVRVINIVNTHELTETTISKKEYMAYIKGYSGFLLKKFKEIVSADDAAVKAFQGALGKFVKDVLTRFDEFSFYTSPNSSDNFGESMLILSDYAADGMTPYFYYFKVGLVEEKC